MTMQSASWESELLVRAYAGLEAEVVSKHGPISPAVHNAQALQDGYALCEEITRLHSHTFYLASSLLPVEKRQAARVLYAFCRITDDLVDRQSDNAQERLQEWALLSGDPHADRHNLVAFAWREVQHRYQIPAVYAEQLVEGVAMDINHARYETFEELVAYCYSVASTVGLMAMHIIGFDGEQAVQYAVKLGVALQLTNILRDIGEDWRNGRVYLPISELRSYGLSEGDIARSVIDERWRKFMKFQIERTRRIYQESLPGVRLLHRDGRFSIAAAGLLYRAILEEIERNDYDVFHRRAHVSTIGKIRRLPSIWLQSL